MDLVLREYLQEAPLSSQKRMDPAFLENMLAQVRTLIVAASGTITNTVCFAYMLLSAHPEVVRKLRDEHGRVFAPGVYNSYDVLCTEPYRLNSLGYTTNVIKETLRLYPIGCTARKEDGDDFLPYEGRQWSMKGFIVLPMQLDMHMNPKIFPNPKAYDQDPYECEGFVQHAWRTFERGPRACLGQPLAMDDLKIILLLTPRDFDLACVGLEPNKTPRVPMPMSVNTSDWA